MNEENFGDEIEQYEIKNDIGLSKDEIDVFYLIVKILNSHNVSFDVDNILNEVVNSGLF